jgi:hypothetical protein
LDLKVIGGSLGYVEQPLKVAIARDCGQEQRPVDPLAIGLGENGRTKKIEESLRGKALVAAGHGKTRAPTLQLHKNSENASNSDQIGP